MINDLLRIFRGVEDIDKVVSDNYIMKNGLYMKVEFNGSITCLLIKNDSIIENDLYLWFKKVDYYSQLIDMNKAVDTAKKIHSNNIYSFFVKCNILPEVGDSLSDNLEKNKKLLSFEQVIEAINRYYDALLENKKDKVVNELLKSVNLDDINIHTSNNNRQFLIDNLDAIINRIKKMGLEEKNFSNKEYIKIFFDAPIEEYIKEYKRYTIPKIFNSNKYNIIDNGKVMGLSNDNMGMNDKKPYLELKSTKFKVPFRLTLEGALESKKMFDWLNALSHDGKPINVLNIPYDYNFDRDLSECNGRKSLYIYKEQENGKTVLKDFDYIPSEIKLEQPFEYKNYLQINNFEEKVITNIKALEQIVDEIFYNNELRCNYFRDDLKPKKNVISSRFIDILFVSKEAMRSYFHKGQELSLKACLKNITLELILDKIIGKEKINWREIATGINLRFNLLRYFKIGGYEGMGDKVINLYNGLREKLKSADLVFIESNEEYYFAVGQLARYILAQSAGANPKHDLLEGFMRAKNPKRMKDTLLVAYEHYSHAIPLNYKRFNSLLAIVLGYEVDDKIDQAIFLAGASYENLLFEKKDKKSEEVKSNEI